MSHSAWAKDPRAFLWVECEGTQRTLDSTVHLDALIQDAKAWGIDTLFIQVYRSDKAWFASRVCDATPAQAFHRREGKDMLTYLLERAHREGIQVHAWFNCFRIGKDKRASILRKLGKTAVTRDNKGRSMLDYPELQLPGKDNDCYEADATGYWLEPGDPSVQAYLLSILRELLTQYPTLDGVQLDFVRLPYVVPFSPGARFPKGITYGYGVRSVERFKALTGWNPLKWDGATASAQAWDAWRRKQITQFVQKAQKEIRRYGPKTALSTAVVCYGDRAYLSAFQEWRSWLLNGDVDFVALMNYGLETDLTAQVTRAALAFANQRPVWVGLGPYLLAERKEIFQKQIRDTRALAREERSPNRKGLGGLGFFSYDSLKKTPGLVAVLKQAMKD